MGWLDTLKGVFKSAPAAVPSPLGTVGAVAGAVSAVGNAVTEGEKLAQQNNERVAGEDHVTAVDNAASAKVNQNVAKAAVDTTDGVALDELRDGRA